ncbi:MAG: tRNA-binding protein [Chitinophagales bacterium]|nr:tRNA-binding protein [Bacteroidota bacterium]MCB9042998.1 tRNA-binding protein [Chitinophagales bacterium]
MKIDYADFEKVEMCVGRIIAVAEFPEARKPAYQLTIDFGETIGIKKSSAQITQVYTPESLLQRLVIAVVNFPPKQIAKFMSEVLVLGVANEQGHIKLLQISDDVVLGSRVY